MTMKKSKTVTDFTLFHFENFDETSRIVDDFKRFQFRSGKEDADRSSFSSVDRTLSSVESVERCESLEDGFCSSTLSGPMNPNTHSLKDM
jgi:hypothetical protein